MVRDAVWSGLLGLAQQRRERPDRSSERRARLRALHTDDRTQQGDGFVTDPQASALALYGPLLLTREPFVLGHLGQSIDGCIATATGHSLYVTGEANLVHLHRLRALCDAVLVGAGTAAADDPRLTVRLVPGDSPVRVVIDPRGTLAPTLGLFTDEGPHTLVVTARGNAPAHVPGERCIELTPSEGRLAPRTIRDALAERGLRCLFLEGGGVTVSRWLQDDALDRLHVAIAPVIIGDGRRGLSLPSATDMPSALRPPAVMHRMGTDVLFDLDLRAG